ncbi:putative fatty acyl-CoA reductase CG5065 [Aethina tumida]|uniref:putative fatty acyl-CoA reductase CG5065 n=1 Tax=Aethina tumida TaxID=116153 RepID=UPI00096B5E6E|nr:putative fatty acyl-CoA reductase CG5065 [Aethina tumida]
MDFDDGKDDIPTFYAGKDVFITGASGFMGKVLIEKLLRSCPEIGNLYLLLRPKKGKSLEERIKQLTDVGLFDSLKESNIGALSKIKPIDGDVSKLNLGISEADTNTLIENVSVIFHAAASVRFDDPLQDAILLNTRGTREIVLLAKKMKKLRSFIHVSTTYCNTDRKVIGEEIYPPHADWQQSIELAENYDRHVLDVLTAKYTGTLPNTYTFTKSMAEHVIKDLCDGQLPVSIIRPSIVISSVKEPFPGWIDNFNGPVGLLVAAGKGVMRSIYTNPNVRADYVPVDLAIKAIILTAWAKGVQSEEERLKLNIFNCSNNRVQAVTSRELVQIGRRLCWEYPLENMLWYPNGNWITTNYYVHFIKMIFYHLIPALFVDGLLKLTNHKPMLVKVHRRIFIANMALEFFIMQEWTFINENILELETKIPEQNREEFAYDKYSPLTIPYVFFKNGIIGAKKYLLKENSNLESDRRAATRLWIVSIIFNALWYYTVFWFLYYKMDILGIILNRLYDAKVYFTTP